MSPFCPGRTLSDCPSPDAADWRRDIREMLEQGMTASEIQAALEARTGGSLSGIPNEDSSYALPIGLATGAALVLYLVLARLRRKDDDTPPNNDSSGAGKSKKKKKSPATPEAVDDKRLEEELDAED
jgi:cytochrome c-type biogenesis protein CcmH/NrfF